MSECELRAALDLMHRIHRLQEGLEDLRRSGGVRSPRASEPIRGGPGAVPPGQIAAERAEEIAQLEKELEVEREIIRRYIVKQDLDELEQRVMLLRYVDCRPWEQVAQTVSYSVRHVIRIGDCAIQKMSFDVMPCHLKG